MRSCRCLLVLSLFSGLQLLVIFCCSSLLNSYSDKQQFSVQDGLDLLSGPSPDDMERCMKHSFFGLEFEILSMSSCPVLSRVRRKYYGWRRSDSHSEGTRFYSGHTLSSSSSRFFKRVQLDTSKTF